MSTAPLPDIVSTIREAMLARMKPIEFDIVASDEPGAIELITDAWTLAIENGPDNPVAWIAIDAEPDTSHEYEKARHDAFRPNEIDALREIDRALNGFLSRALTASQDPFSAHIAAVLADAASPG